MDLYFPTGSRDPQICGAVAINFSDQFSSVQSLYVVALACFGLGRMSCMILLPVAHTIGGLIVAQALGTQKGTFLGDPQKGMKPACVLEYRYHFSQFDCC